MTGLTSDVCVEELECVESLSAPKAPHAPTIATMMPFRLNGHDGPNRRNGTSRLRRTLLHGQ